MSVFEIVVERMRFVSSLSLDDRLKEVRMAVLYRVPALVLFELENSSNYD